MSVSGKKRGQLVDDSNDVEEKENNNDDNPPKKRKLNWGDAATNDKSVISKGGLAKVVIVGTGLVGRSWAVLFARGGNYRVTLYDIDEKQLTAALDDIKNNKLPLLSQFNMLNCKQDNSSNKSKDNSNSNDKSDNLEKVSSSSSMDQIMSNIETSTNLVSALSNAFYIQMAVPENLELKQKVLSQIETALDKNNNNECIIGSSCSTIVPSKLIKLLKNKEHISRFLVCHPVNPPMAIPLVEIVPSPSTDINVCHKAKEIMLSIGMKPIVMEKECVGFLLNRMQYALLQEAYQIYEEGYASAKDIDLVISNGLGTRWSFMGPFETIHLNAPSGVSDYCNRYVSSCMEPVLNNQNKDLKWKPETWNKIHDELAKDIPIDKIAQRCQWRDNRLMQLAKLKNEQELQDSAKKEDKK